jgi:hypothetical protein
MPDWLCKHKCGREETNEIIYNKDEGGLKNAYSYELMAPNVL